MPEMLAEWVAHLNGESAPNLLTKVLRQRLKAIGFPTRQEDADLVSGNTSLSEVLDPSQYIGHQLKFLWGDPAFWKLVRDDKSATALRRFVLSDYSLIVPPMSAGVWLEAVRHQRSRSALFTALARDHKRIAGFAVLERRAIVEMELQKKSFPRIFYKCLTNPRLDGKHLLASAGFSKETLQVIADTASRVAKDAAWCLENPGQIPYGVLKKKRGRPLDMAVVERVERMVELLRQQQDLSDSEVVKLFNKGGNEEDAMRKSLAVARELLRYREGILQTKV